MTSPAKKDVDKSIKKCWDLKAGTEFRFEVSVSQSITLKLCSGTAEIYGSELALGKEYVFSGVKYAVFSFDGASIEVSGACAVEYVSSECVVPYFLNLHLCLESIRIAAQNRTCKSPRVLIVGNGRNSCARTLINYSVRHERTPLVADMDVMNGNLLFPGVIVSSSINRMIEPEESFQLSSPLAFYYGSPDWTANYRYFYQLIESLGQQVKDRLAAIESPLTKNEKNKYSGLLAIFPTWIDGKAEQLLKRTIAALQINLVVVVGNERLYNFIQKEHESKEVKILSITKSPGLVTKDSSFRRYQTARQIKEYFYGFADEFYPYSQTLGFKEVEIWKIEDGNLQLFILFTFRNCTACFCITNWS